MNPGYYINQQNEIVIVYPDGLVEFYWAGCSCWQHFIMNESFARYFEWDFIEGL